MDGYLTNNQQKTGMLGKEIKICIFSSLFFIGLFTSCESRKRNDDGSSFYNASSSIIGLNDYTEIFKKANDSLGVFYKYNLPAYNFLNSGSWYIDSLICFNKGKNRFISCILYTTSNFKDSNHDGIQYFYGEAINNKWYFFKGNNIHIPREIVKGHDVHSPLPYKQLHQIALKEVFGGYLKNNGEINEEWFTSHFENVGWCGTCKTTEDFQKSRLENVKTLWLQRDTSQPIKQLPNKTNLP